jgi:hypothetical protein
MTVIDCVVLWRLIWSFYLYKSVGLWWKYQKLGPKVPNFSTVSSDLRYVLQRRLSLRKNHECLGCIEFCTVLQMLVSFFPIILSNFQLNTCHLSTNLKFSLITSSKHINFNFSLWVPFVFGGHIFTKIRAEKQQFP